MSLRRLLMPFFKATHPDLLSHASAQVKRTNERSLQQLNTIIDTLEHLGGRSAGAAAAGGRPGPAPHLQSSYELTFHLVAHQQKEEKEEDGKDGRHTMNKSSSFTARLLFPPTTVARFQREAPLKAPTPAEHPPSTPSSPSLLPDEIAHQLRKLFQGARLRVPQELAESGKRGSRHGGGSRRRGGMIGAAEAERMLVADLMGRDLRVEGPTPAQRRAAVGQLLRSGRVLTKGLAPAEEVGALRQLEQVLVQEWDRAHLDVAAAGAAAMPGGVQIVLDAEAETLSWRVLEDGRGHLLVVPAEDIRGCRYRLAAVLREIGQRAMAAREAAAAEGMGGRVF